MSEGRSVARHWRLRIAGSLLSIYSTLTPQKETNITVGIASPLDPYFGRTMATSGRSLVELRVLALAGQRPARLGMGPRCRLFWPLKHIDGRLSAAPGRRVLPAKGEAAR